jgi:hypothetical protein
MKERHMAINVEFTGYVNEIKSFDWGQVVKMTHQQRAKNALNGEWETVGRDYIDVTLGEGVEAPAENTVAKVTGTMKVDLYDKLDGGKGLGIKVRASALEVVQTKKTEDEAW